MKYNMKNGLPVLNTSVYSEIICLHFLPLLIALRKSKTARRKIYQE